MSQSSPMKIKVEEGSVRGSLGTLLACYADSDDEIESDHDAEGQPTDQVKPKTETLPNPFRPGAVITFGAVKAEPEDNVDSENEDNFFDAQSSASTDGSSLMHETETKPESGSVPESGGVVNGNNTNGFDSSSHTDFATLKGTGKQTEMVLDVEDFFDATEPYVEARQVKQEVESDSSSGTSDSEVDSESEEESEESSSPTSDNEDEGDDEARAKKKEAKTKKKKDLSDGPRVKGELRLCDLPPIEDLHISVPHDDCKPIGVIKSVVEPLVIVEAYPETPALDLDSVLFLEEGDRALGHIFDVIGQVKQPMYCVRFNSKEHIEKSKVEIGMQVYCAPKTEYTSFVFLAQLKAMKGSDASWLNDEEPPPDEVDYSDDEMERMAKKRRRQRRNLRLRATEEDAIDREGQPVPENTNRGPKRRFNQNGPGPAPTNGDHNSYQARPTNPPFYPPMVPGFLPYGPPFPGPGSWASPGYHHQHFQQHFRGNPHRSRNGRPFHHRFRPPPPPPPPPSERPPFVPPQQPDNPFRSYNNPNSGAGSAASENRFPGPGPNPQASWYPPPPPPNQWQNDQRHNFNFAPSFPQLHFGPRGMAPRPPPPPPPPPPGQ